MPYEEIHALLDAEGKEDDAFEAVGADLWRSEESCEKARQQLEATEGADPLGWAYLAGAYAALALARMASMTNYVEELRD